jgi:hypothetical protein
MILYLRPSWDGDGVFDIVLSTGGCDFVYDQDHSEQVDFMDCQPDMFHYVARPTWERKERYVKCLQAWLKENGEPGGSPKPVAVQRKWWQVWKGGRG